MLPSFLPREGLCPSTHRELFFQSQVDGFDLRTQCWKVVDGGFPDDVEIYTKIVVSDLITHSGDLAPCDFGMGILYLL